MYLLWCDGGDGGDGKQNQRSGHSKFEVVLEQLESFGETRSELQVHNASNAMLHCVIVVGELARRDFERGRDGPRPHDMYATSLGGYHYGMCVRSRLFLVTFRLGTRLGPIGLATVCLVIVGRHEEQGLLRLDAKNISGETLLHFLHLYTTI